MREELRPETKHSKVYSTCLCTCIYMYVCVPYSLHTGPLSRVSQPTVVVQSRMRGSLQERESREAYALRVSSQTFSMQTLQREIPHANLASRLLCTCRISIPTYTAYLSIYKCLLMHCLCSRLESRIIILTMNGKKINF